MSELQQYNSDVSKWALATKRKIKLEVLRLVLNIGHGHDRQDVAVRRYMGEAAKINFAFPYYMVFVHKGAGRGYGGNKTGLFSKRNGGKGKTSVSSMGKMGTGKRKPKPFFNPVLEKEFPQLADIVANYKGSKAIVNIQKILIK